MMSPSAPTSSRVRFTSSVFFRMPSRPSAGPCAIASFNRLKPNSMCCSMSLPVQYAGMRLGRAAKQLVNRHPERVADHIPERQIHSADRMGHHAGSTVVHRGAPENIPNALDVKRVRADQQLGQMLLNDGPAAY